MEEQKTENPVKTEAADANLQQNTGNSSENTEKSNSKIPLIAAAIILVLAALVYLFIRLSPETTGLIRDIMIVLFVLESIVTVVALVVLIIQIANLLSFLKYEVSPILSTTKKTIKKFSGTVSFLCDNAVEPTVNAASTLSGIKNAADGILALFKK